MRRGRKPSPAGTHSTVVVPGAGADLEAPSRGAATSGGRFFRDASDFDYLAERANSSAATGHRLRFWIMGCGEGEDAYSLAIALWDVLPVTVDCRILATDAAADAIARARRGNYPPTAVQGMPENLAADAFNRQSASAGPLVRVKDDIKRMVLFRRLDPMRTPYGVRGRFDAIVCRNLLQKMSTSRQDGLLAEAWRLLRPDGRLILGRDDVAPESGTARFTVIRHAIYRRD